MASGRLAYHNFPILDMCIILHCHVPMLQALRYNVYVHGLSEQLEFLSSVLIV